MHEANLRLVGLADAAKWDGRGHFFAATAEAMRRILVEAARRRRRERHGGCRHRVTLTEDVPDDLIDSGLLAVDQLADHDASTAELVKHVFRWVTD